jgi:hypothetical protein
MNFSKQLLIPLVISTAVFASDCARAGDLSCLQMSQVAVLANTAKAQDMPERVVKLMIADSFKDATMRKQATAVSDFIYASETFTDDQAKKKVLLLCMEARHGKTIK